MGRQPKTGRMLPTSTMPWHEDVPRRCRTRPSACKRRLSTDEPSVVCKKSRTDEHASMHNNLGTMKNEKPNEIKVYRRRNRNLKVYRRRNCSHVTPVVETMEKNMEELCINLSMVLGPQTPSPAEKGCILSKESLMMSEMYPSKSRAKVQSKKDAFQAEELENPHYYTRLVHSQVISTIESLEKAPTKTGRIITVWKELLKKTIAEETCTLSRTDDYALGDGKSGLFNKKVNSFISEVGAIQGRRHFSPWKGSVLDSVIGTFLAQRVSDNQSSFAFMSLGVSFPNCHDCKTYNRQDRRIRGKFLTVQDTKGCTLKLGNERNESFAAKENGTPRKGKLVSCLCQKSDELKLRYKGKKSIDEYKKTKGNLSKSEIHEHDCNKLNIKHSKNIERSTNAIDYVDWGAVMTADVEDISKAIAMRGMNNKLSSRIKNFLGRVTVGHQHTDLEWLRSASLDESMKYLRGIHGFGPKSASCVQLLTLQQPAFPVDINVARVVVRLGLVPLPPNVSDELLMSVVEEVSSLHDLINQYLWPWLVALDHKTLYELHCQMITFGKVFCTKKKPKCSECPMKKDCKYFGDADIEDLGNEKTLMSVYQDLLKLKRKKLKNPNKSEQLFPDGEAMVPKTPIKDQSLLKFRHVKQPKDSYSDETKLKIGKTSTQHTVYELPDRHPILEKYDKSDPDDPYPYLLLTWESGQNDLDQIVKNTASCGRSYENTTQTIPGTILIPCRTAVQGKFPLNGTYFQMNEVFADDETAKLPIQVNCETLLQLNKKALYCGTSLSEICKGLSKDEIKSLFNEGYICTRGIVRKYLAPVSLHKRLHTSK